MSVADDVLILGPVSLEIAPGTLVALMGASGSGKSTLLRILAGVDDPTAGSAAWAREPTSSAVQALGYVPQRESVHDRLTTREALQYAACLRLNTRDGVNERVETVLGELGLVAQADTLIRNLSGGERRRAACGLELVGDPPVLLLDEPTSGLDTMLERRLMELFRQLADHGRAVLVATHATASLDLCDEVIVLRPGQPVYRGIPSDAQLHLAGMAHPSRQTSDAISVASPAGLGADASASPDASIDVLNVSSKPELVPTRTSRSVGLELRVLTGRYFLTFTRDRRTLALLLGQAPIIGLLIASVFHPGTLTAASASPINSIDLVFLLMTGSVWLGVTSACREVVKERGLVEREFDVGVRPDVYLTAKVVVLFTLNVVQVLWLTIVVIGLRPLGVGPNGVIEIFVIAVLTAWASTAMGLAVSCAARSADQAAGAVPLLLIPQLLLAGGLIPLAQMPQIAAAVANLVYARWSFAGLASSARIGQRLSEYDYSSALGFNTDFFSIVPASAALILIGFTLAQLLAAVFFLSHRPPVNA